MVLPYYGPPPFYPPYPFPPMPIAKPPLRGKLLVGMILSLIGGVLALAGPFFLFVVSDYGRTIACGIQNLPPACAYGWLIVIGGLLSLIFGILCGALKIRAFGLMPLTFGIIAFVFAIVLPIHLGVDAGNIGFYFQYYTGGYVAMVGSVFAFVGGILLLVSFQQVVPWTQFPTVPAFLPAAPTYLEPLPPPTQYYAPGQYQPPPPPPPY